MIMWKFLTSVLEVSVTLSTPEIVSIYPERERAPFQNSRVEEAWDSNRHSINWNHRQLEQQSTSLSNY